MEFGCKLSNYDIRDYKLKSGVASSSVLPDSYSCPLLAPVKNQGAVSSCVAHATSSILEYHAVHDKSLSTNFIYGIQHQLCGHDGKGMYLRDACKIALKYGDMFEEDCPGNTEVPNCYSIAEGALQDETKAASSYKHRILKYFTCKDNDEIKHALYNYGPVLGSIKWYNNFKTDKDGVLRGEQSGKYGYHAIMIYGYTPEGFWCQNSWGKSWGKGGRFFLPNDIKIREARGFVDFENDEELVVPSDNTFMEVMYKIVNCVMNFLKSLFK